MQIEIMRHHSRTNDPQRHCQLPMVQDLLLGNKALQDSRQIWLSNNDFVTKDQHDDQNQCHDDRFDFSETQFH